MPNVTTSLTLHFTPDNRCHLQEVEDSAAGMRRQVAVRAESLKQRAASARLSCSSSQRLLLTRLSAHSLCTATAARKALSSASATVTQASQLIRTLSANSLERAPPRAPP
eukprot:CAMPEP_0114146372 /NCGR_PEP_ID=MMETSP0043_2-20121206/20532_1 /TAXON_ID=464988 /ORGANISM="Hemiselmis andersenii, Strain CCMP644" /LENGTH=109 /DNA_ID=CAMNT_0001240827 /DNA_START=227 /DNA_END=553 /DNA_ORIENTATION=-